ncbi:hypothetical protein TrRE_jg2725 [Triparma retinervis]|uniref:Uncharacterized protein n=1 Tax=Triparma retinervis TaxID=2557542 RepID=A0A9W7CHC9_9STRA|nr:hypothetical protein TrRE_jg2725 [Triparma retinervis]
MFERDLGPVKLCVESAGISFAVLSSQLPSILQKIDSQLQSPTPSSPQDEIVSCKWKLRPKGSGEKELLQWYENERKIGLSKLLSSTSTSLPPGPEAIISYVETTTKQMVELFGGKLKATCEGYRVPKDPRIIVKRTTLFLSAVKLTIDDATSEIFASHDMESLTNIRTSLDLPATPEVNWRELQTSNYFTYLFGSTFEDSVEKFIVKNIISTIDSVLDEDYLPLEKIGSIGEGGRGAVLTVIGVVIANLMDAGLPGARSIVSLNSFVSSSSIIREILKKSAGPISGIDLEGFESAHGIGGDSTGNIGASSLVDILSLQAAPAHFKLIPRLLSHITLPLATLLCATYLNLRDIDAIEDVVDVVVRDSVDSIGEDAALQDFIDISFYKFCNNEISPKLAARLAETKVKADPMALELANVDVNIPAIYHSHSALLNSLYTPVSLPKTSTTGHNKLPPANSLFETKAKFKPFAVVTEEEEEEEERRRKRAKASVEKKEVMGGLMSNLWGGLK